MSEVAMIKYKHNYLNAGDSSVFNTESGLSLIELMVALTLGVFIVASTLQVFVGSRQSHSVIQSQSTMQEAVRFGFYFIGASARQAGYLDAGDLTEGNNLFANELVNLFNAAVKDPSASVNGNPFVENPWQAVGHFTESSVIAGADNFTGDAGSGSVSIKANTDVLRIRLQGDPDGFVSDCEGIVIDGGLTSIISFFVSDDDQLYCQVDARTPVALVAGIENMQLLYGVAANQADDAKKRFIVDQYVTADSITADGSGVLAWQKVMTVRVGLLASSDTESLDKSQQTYTILDVQNISFTDGKARQVFTQTIALRGNLST